MSSDEIFAAHMWAWPDPMIKRNAQGGILFINAAFLRMYGGQASDWQGNTVSGWPAPSGAPTPNRFETRLPSAQGEQVYDWIEYTLADGGTLGIARDVTALIAAPQPQPVIQAPVQQDPVQQEPVVQQAPVQQAPADNMMAEQAPQLPEIPAVAAAAVSAVAIPALAAQAIPFEPNQVQVNETPNTLENTPTTSAFGMEAEEPAFKIPTIEVPEIEVPKFEAPQYTAPENAPVSTVETEAVASEVEAEVPAAQAPVSETPVAPLTAERDYERRALPIENDEAVLGTNWRDAVIAKAVGGALPKTEAVEEAPEETALQQEKKKGEPLSILLAEDNAINALLTRTLLEADGCNVDVVEDGALAVEAMKSKYYDMIFMDMRMPNMDGLESTRKIRALPNVPKDLPIVALTANAFDDDRNACFDSGMNDFMTKPVSVEELHDMVNQWARKKKSEAA